MAMKMSLMTSAMDMAACVLPKMNPTSVSMISRNGSYAPVLAIMSAMMAANSIKAAAFVDE